MQPSPYWTPEQLRIQARLEADDTSADVALELYGKAAIRAIEHYTGRTLYPPGEALPADAAANALVADESVQLAALMMVAHWFENPAAVAEGAAAEVPFGFRFLVEPHRFINL